MNRGRQLFISATDTGVGKTLISGLLLSYLREQGIKAGYQKWVATGCADGVEDLTRVVELAGREESEIPPDLQVPCRFPRPASPHLAAELAGLEIDPGILIKAHARMRERYEFLLVEGVGGLMVPLRRDLLLADLVARLQTPTLLVARSGLGTLNHTLLSLEALRRREIPVVGVLLTDGPSEEEAVAADNLRTIAEIGHATVFGRLPWGNSDAELRRSFAPMAEAIIATL